jgi:hypothetical protein
MTEAAAALRDAGLPDTMIRGAEEVFDAWAAYRDSPPSEPGALFARLHRATDQDKDSSEDQAFRNL